MYAGRGRVDFEVGILREVCIFLAFLGPIASEMNLWPGVVTDILPDIAIDIVPGIGVDLSVNDGVKPWAAVVNALSFMLMVRLSGRDTCCW